ncbi:hypothetical protein F66182_2818 [Fusarium sp. NRRL 66182]|nr:hypothetical protein F66182_2818 [Fusarium sp. NRRL 66182]
MDLPKPPGPRTIKIFSPALAAFPTLLNFLPAFQPRRFRHVPPSGHHHNGRTKEGKMKEVKFKLRLRSMTSLYHDLGTLVFAGANPEQVEQIGDILAQAVLPDGRMQVNQAADGSGLRHQYNKHSVYRLNVKDEHIDSESPRHHMGVLSKSGLCDLSKQVFEMWKRDFDSEIQKHDGSESYLEVQNTTVMPYHKSGAGQHRLPVEVYVATREESGSVFIDLEFNSVGTRHYLGKVIMTAKQDEDARTLAENETTGVIYKYAPSTVQQNTDMTCNITNRLWDLEKQIWAGRENKRQPWMKRDQSHMLMEWPPKPQRNTADSSGGKSTAEKSKDGIAGAGL